MKKILTIIAVTACTVALTYGQGTVLFDTSKAGAGAKVLEAVGFPGAGLALGNTIAGVEVGSHFLMQLYGAPGNVSDSASLVPLGFPVNSRGGTGNSGFSQISGTTSLGVALTAANTTVTIPTPSGGGPVTLQLRAWWAGADGRTYTTYEQGSTDGDPLKRFGASPLLFLAATGNPNAQPPGTPVDLIGLQGFQLQAVPEPGVFALLGLGLLGLWTLRRK